ncbi:MAG: mCpol domain-containing protein [Rhizobiaceae bacterium]
MPFISIDGDDIGRRIAAYYLTNDPSGLSAFAEAVHDNVRRITKILAIGGHRIIFSAADGVVAEILEDLDTVALYQQIADTGASNITFSAGIGNTLRESYVALLAAKSRGKARLYHYADIG